MVTCINTQYNFFRNILFVPCFCFPVVLARLAVQAGESQAVESGQRSAGESSCTAVVTVSRPAPAEPASAELVM